MRSSPVRSAQHAQTRPRERAATWLLAVLLALAVAGIVAGVHWPALDAQAISFDDSEYLLNNALVQNPSWASATRFLTEVLRPSTVGGYYQPLSMISLMLDVASGGSPDSLRAFHRTSLALHALNTALVLLLLYSLFHRPLIVGGAALLFGLHPLTVETIPWVSERKTLLATCFALLCLITYVRYAAGGRGRGALYALSLLCCALALLSKPTTTPLPLLLLVLDYWPLRRLSLRVVLEKAPFVALAGISAVITFLSQAGTSIAVLPGDQPAMRAPLIVCHNIVFYLGKILWPARLSSHYPIPAPLSVANPAIIIGIVGTLVLLALVLLSLRRTRAIAAGSAFFLVAIFPTLGIIGFSSTVAANKFVYFPAIGLLMLLCWAAIQVDAWAGVAGRRTRVRLAGATVLLALTVAEAGGTREQYSYWRDAETLHRHMLALAPDSPVVHYSLGLYLHSRGRFVEAEAEYRAALAREPLSPDLHHHLGTVLVRLRRADEAFHHFQEALRLAPTYAASHNEWGAALVGAGHIDEGIEHLREAIRLRAGYAEAHYNLGLALVAARRPGEAIDEYRKALAINPRYVEARNNLAVTLAQMGQITEATAQFRTIIEQQPDASNPRMNLAMTLANAGDAEAAMRELREGLRLRPADPDLHCALGILLRQQQRPDEAIREFQEALRLAPNHDRARSELALTTTSRSP